MSNLDEKAKIHKIATSCFVDELEINRIKKAVDLIITTSENSYKTGYLACQKEYEEKLQWIPISEKTPSETIKLEVKTVEGHIHLATYISEIGKFYSDFINSPYQIVAWRYFL